MHLSKSKATGNKLLGIASCRGISHVGKLVSFRGLGMFELVEKSRRNRAVENEVSIKELNLLDRFPSSKLGRLGLWARTGRIVVFVRTLGIGTIGVL